MTAPTAQQRLTEILDAGFSGTHLTLVQISASIGTLNFEAKPGWLRYQSNLQHSDYLVALDDTVNGQAIAGEWIIDATATARLTIEDGQQLVRIITERPQSDVTDTKWIDVLAESVAVYSREVRQGDDTPLTQPNYSKGQINHRVYYGFRDNADAQTGTIRRIADRMMGWKALPAAAQPAHTPPAQTPPTTASPAPAPPAEPEEPE